MPNTVKDYDNKNEDCIKDQSKNNTNTTTTIFDPKEFKTDYFLIKNGNADQKINRLLN